MTGVTPGELAAMKTQAQLLAPYIGRWDIQSPALCVWRATRRTPGPARCITAPTARQLAQQLATADPEET